MERRKISKHQKNSTLPVDFNRMVADVLTTTYDAGLRAVEKFRPGKAFFTVRGSIFPDEIMVAVTIGQKDQIIATTIYASSDYDPRASSPNAQDVLGLCVDGIGSVLEYLFDDTHAERIEQLAQGSLAALDDVPFDWTPFKVQKREIFLRMDKANPELEEAAEDWLAKNDPNDHARREAEHRATEELFVTGKPRAKGAGDPDDNEDDDAGWEAKMLEDEGDEEDAGSAGVKSGGRKGSGGTSGGKGSLH